MSKLRTRDDVQNVSMRGVPGNQERAIASF